MFWVVLPPIIRSAYNCIYNIWYLSHSYCSLLLSWKSWNWFQCAVGGIYVNCSTCFGWYFHPSSGAHTVLSTVYLQHLVLVTPLLLSAAIVEELELVSVCCGWHNWKLLYMFRVVLPPITRSAYNCIYSVWYFSHRYCYLQLSWKNWN